MLPKILESFRSRRDFFKISAAISAGGLGSLTGHQAIGETETKVAGPLIAPGNVILFQGDSITDAGRGRKAAGQPNHQPAMGIGYAWLATAELLIDRPDDRLKIYNRGISGNKVFQLADRWQTDCLDLRPDVLSILIGVNDIWHQLNDKYDGTVEVYERDYGKLLERTRKALPSIKLVVCEPFVLRCGAVTDKWFPSFDEYRSAARRVSDAHHATWVPFQTMFDKALQYAPPEHWARDGVHPTAHGAAIMAHLWLKTVNGGT